MDAITLSEQLAQGCSDREPTIATAIPPQYPRNIIIDGQTADSLNSCPWAKTLIERNKLTKQYRLRSQSCKRWSCIPCARVKTRDLAQWTKLAAPNKLLTLTVNPQMHSDPQIAWLDTAKKIPELIRELRKRFGPIEYLRVVEETQNHWPHYHMMIRSGYLPQPVIKSEWARLTGATIVDIRQVSQFFNSFAYLVKYLTKLQRVEWTDRHVTYSRKFFPCSITPKSEPTEWQTIETRDDEPWKFLNSRYPYYNLQQSSPTTFSLPELRTHPWAPIPPKKIPIHVQKNLAL